MDLSVGNFVVLGLATALLIAALANLAVDLAAWIAKVLGG